jgi:hypothetical protein
MEANHGSIESYMDPLRGFRINDPEIGLMPFMTSFKRETSLFFPLVAKNLQLLLSFQL